MSRLIWSAIAALALSAALSACGKKAPLRPPPGPDRAAAEAL